MRHWGFAQTRAHCESIQDSNEHKSCKILQTEHKEPAAALWIIHMAFWHI